MFKDEYECLACAGEGIKLKGILLQKEGCTKIKKMRSNPNLSPTFACPWSMALGTHMLGRNMRVVGVWGTSCLRWRGHEVRAFLEGTAPVIYAFQVNANFLKIKHSM